MTRRLPREIADVTGARTMISTSTVIPAKAQRAAKPGAMPELGRTHGDLGSVPAWLPALRSATAGMTLVWKLGGSPQAASREDGRVGLP